MRTPFGRKRLLLLSLSLLLLAGCRGSGSEGDPDLEVRVGISPTPPLVGPTRILLDLTDAGTPLLDPAIRIMVEGGMTHAGMVPVLDSARPEGERWVVPAFDFTMAGDWILTWSIVLPEGRSARRTTSVRVTGGDGSGHPEG